MLKITKRQILYNGFNDMEGYFWYYFFNFRIYNAENTRYVKYGFVVNFTFEDMQEAECTEPKEYAGELADCFIDSYNPSFENRAEFIKACSETIERYNRRINSFRRGFSRG